MPIRYIENNPTDDVLRQGDIDRRAMRQQRRQDEEYGRRDQLDQAYSRSAQSALETIEAEETPEYFAAQEFSRTPGGGAAAFEAVNQIRTRKANAGKSQDDAIRRSLELADDSPGLAREYLKRRGIPVSEDLEVAFKDKGYRGGLKFVADTAKAFGIEDDAWGGRVLQGYLNSNGNPQEALKSGGQPSRKIPQTQPVQTVINGKPVWLAHDGNDWRVRGDLGSPPPKEKPAVDPLVERKRKFELAELEAEAAPGAMGVDDFGERTRTPSFDAAHQKALQKMGLSAPPDAFATGDIYTPKTDEDFALIPSGGTYIDPEDGEFYEKP